MPERRHYSQFVPPTAEAVLAGYDAVKSLYPTVPPLSMWRAWESAAYRGKELPEPVLDVGCGDGAYFRLTWPKVRDASGVDADSATVELARASGVYREVSLGGAHELPFPTGHFASAFANCSLEHMDRLPEVLSEIFRVLKPGGIFLSSVVTDKFVTWSALPDLLKAAGAPENFVQAAREQHKAYHHLANPLAAEEWQRQFEQAGFDVTEHIPIVPAGFGHVFLFLDSVWHLPGGEAGTELGSTISAWASNIKAFPEAFRLVLEGLLAMGKGETEAAGAIFMVKKPEAAVHLRPDSPVPSDIAACVPPAPGTAAPGMSGTQACWCGENELAEFSPDYLVCKRCQTLIVRKWPSTERFQVVNDETDFYGQKYYGSHVVENYHLPSLEERTRSDLPERCLHWLRTVLKYSLPPAKTLELGCAHGGFVAMMRQAGFDATGLEMSPSLVTRARSTFDIPVLVGSVEEQDIANGSLDLILHFDVLEHLPDPRASMKRCLDLLKPDGLMILQTPCYPEEVSYLQMVEQKSRFLEQLKPMEHLCLFSRTSLKRLFHELGAPYVAFEPAIFAHYDMFAVISRNPLRSRSETEAVLALQAGGGGRIIQALIDADTTRQAAQQAFQSLAAHHAICEQDREARLMALLELDAAQRELSLRHNETRQHLEKLRAREASRKKELEKFKAECRTARAKLAQIRSVRGAARALWHAITQK